MLDKLAAAALWIDLRGMSREANALTGLMMRLAEDDMMEDEGPEDYDPQAYSDEPFTDRRVLDPRDKSYQREVEVGNPAFYEQFMTDIVPRFDKIVKKTGLPAEIPSPGYHGNSKIIKAPGLSKMTARDLARHHYPDATLDQRDTMIPNEFNKAIGFDPETKESKYRTRFRAEYESTNHKAPEDDPDWLPEVEERDFVHDPVLNAHGLYDDAYSKGALPVTDGKLYDQMLKNPELLGEYMKAKREGLDIFNNPEDAKKWFGESGRNFLPQSMRGFKRLGPKSGHKNRYPRKDLLHGLLTPKSQ